MEVFGDLHEFGALAKTVTLAQVEEMLIVVMNEDCWGNTSDNINTVCLPICGSLLISFVTAWQI